MTSYLNKLFWTSLRSKPGGVTVYRGYSAALKGSGHEKKGLSKSTSRRNSTTSRRGSISSIRSTGISAENEKVKEKEREKEKSKSGWRKSLEIPNGGEDMRRSSSAPGGAASIDAATVPLPSVAKRKVDQAKEEIEEEGKQSDDQATSSREAIEEEQVPTQGAEIDDLECTDLILVIHGIGKTCQAENDSRLRLTSGLPTGQQLATTYEGFNFVYATNMLRQVMRSAYYPFSPMIVA